MLVRPRHFHSVVHVAVFALVTQVWVFDVHAQTTPTEARSPSPAELEAPSLSAGDRLRAAGDLKAALHIYRAVYGRAETAEAQQRIAEAELRLGHDGYAYSEYAKLLDRFGSALTRADRKRLEKRLKKLDTSTGLLAFDQLPLDAVIRVDDEPVPKSLSSTPLRLTRGERRLEIEIASHKPVRFIVSVGAVPVRMKLSFEPLMTMAAVQIGVRDDVAMNLYVDGTNVGPLPQRIQLPPGKHAVSADGVTHFVPPQPLVVETPSAMDLVLVAVEKPAVVEIHPTAADAILFLDEQPLGSGTRRLELSRGKHVLELRRSGFRAQRLVYDAKPGQFHVLRAMPYVPLRNLPQAVASPPAQTAPASKAPPRAATRAPSPEHERDDHPFRGLYGGLFVPMLLGGESTHSYVSSCPADTYGGTCSTTAPRGGGLALRLGYFYEWIGLEVFGAGAVDVSSAQIGLPPIPTVTEDMLALAERTVFVRAGGLIGGGLRLSTPIKGIRVSIGADYVHAARKVVAIPDSFAGASLGYSAPGYFVDGGIELGSTPGTRFYLGAFLFVENAPDLVLNRDLAALSISTTVPSELTTMTVYRGRQYLFGPLLGLAFGH
jgi:hypothetical protein